LILLSKRLLVALGQDYTLRDCAVFLLQDLDGLILYLALSQREWVELTIPTYGQQGKRNYKPCHVVFNLYCLQWKTYKRRSR